MNEKIKPTRLADTIAEHLERLILEGSLRPGEKLAPERELAQKLDVSRPSLRDALAKLEKRGLLVTGRSGSVVAQFLEPVTDPLVALFQTDPETTFDYLEFRGVIEGSAAYYAAIRATDVDRCSLRACADRMRAAHSLDDSTEEADVDADFHLGIYEAAHNVVLLHIMRALSNLLRKDVFYNRARLYARNGVRELLLKQHLAIADAVLAGDPDGARTAAEAHMTFTQSTLQEIRKADQRLEVALRRVGRSELLAAEM